MMMKRLPASAARVVLTAILTVSPWLLPSAAAAQPRGTATAARDARETRDELRELLAQYPPALAQVLRLDPSLLSKPDYLAPYPQLASFLSEHPDVARTPAYFFGESTAREADNIRLRAVNMMQDVMAGFMIFSGFAVALLSIGWVIRTMLADRRWQRLTKTQTEAHAKLLERLTSHDDLLAYIQSPSGKRFLDAAPVSLGDSERPRISAPVARILWSVQAGVVLVAIGLGLFFAKNQVFEEVGSALFVFGILALALGVGFVASALVAYALSQRLGLLDAAHAHDA
jgi:hypothetical protein